MNFLIIGGIEMFDLLLVSKFVFILTCLHFNCCPWSDYDMPRVYSIFCHFLEFRANYFLSCYLV